MTTSPTPADVLRDAARYLETHGWHQGSLYADENTNETDNPTPAACAIGALSIVVLGHRVPEDLDEIAGSFAYRQASDILDDYLILSGAKNTVPVPDGHHLDSVSVGDWNDAPGRTATEVISAMRAAADDYDRTHSGHPMPTGPCWSDFCIASFCDGIHHVDATGYAWTEARPAPGGDQ